LTERSKKVSEKKEGVEDVVSVDILRNSEEKALVLLEEIVFK
jgi:hypothetical protein